MAEVDGRFDVADTKTRSLRRTLSVPASLIDELAEHLATHRHGTRPDDLVFSAAEGGPLRRSFEGRIFKQDIKDTGLDPALTFHGLRHVAASLMVEHGEHPRVIQARLGPATARLSMELYAHVPDAADRQLAHFDAGWAANESATIGHAAGTQRRGNRR
jgi:integrase